MFSLLDPSDRQTRSASLSSDDVTGLSQSQLALSRSSTLPYDHVPQRAQPQRGVGVRSKTCTSSPVKDMLTLEEFLHESNLKSPPMVRDVCSMGKTSHRCRRWDTCKKSIIIMQTQLKDFYPSCSTVGYLSLWLIGSTMKPWHFISK